MTNMPYHLEKGMLMAVFDDMSANASTTELCTCLDRLRNGRAIEECGPFDAAALYGSGWPVDVVEHLNRDWFGYMPNPSTATAAPKWVPQVPADLDTGWWVNYCGNVEKIVRRTMIHALEVSLGVPSWDSPAGGAHVAAVATRRWPISYLVKCSQAFFEGWISWTNTPGAVTVVFATPADRGIVWATPDPLEASRLRSGPLDWALFQPPGKPAALYPIENPSLTDNHGMVVITHRDHDVQLSSQFVDETLGDVLTILTRGTPPQDIPIPEWGGRWEADSIDDVVCVSPSMRHGGLREPLPRYDVKVGP
jgi:hypothetical protein